jgi:hypothetical protein
VLVGDHTVIAAAPLRDPARDWLADHLAALVWMALALWAPPIVFAVLVNLELVGGAGSGYPTLRDPGLLLGVMQMVVMMAAVPLLHRRRRSRAWHLLCGSLGIWAMHAAWTIQGRLRLIGRSDLLSRETIVTVAALLIASVVLFEVRHRYTRTAAATARPTTSQQPARLRPDTT